MTRFKNRAEAGKKLATMLTAYRGNKSAIVIGLPRGGVVTAFEVAHALGLRLDIIVTRKIGAPGQPELAVGALTQDGEPMFNHDLMMRLQLVEGDLTPIVADERQETQRRLTLYRADRDPLDLHEKIAIIVDDGIATGATIRAAIKSARTLQAKKIVVAVPVCPPDVLETIKSEVDEVVCILMPPYFPGVGAFYEQFAQTEDASVIELLQRAG